MIGLSEPRDTPRARVAHELPDAGLVRGVVASSLGPAAARDAALAVVSGEILAFIDDDRAARPAAITANPASARLAKP
jgi:hypothetical protein